MRPLSFFNVITQDQKARLSTPAYQKKKEKCDQKPSQKSQIAPLQTPILVSVFGVAKDRRGMKSEEVSSTPGAKAKRKSSEESISRNVKDKKAETTKGKSPAKVIKPSKDSKLLQPDNQKWSEMISRVEAMLLTMNSTSQSRLFSQWSFPQPGIHQPVLQTSLRHF